MFQTHYLASMIFIILIQEAAILHQLHLTLHYCMSRTFWSLLVGISAIMQEIRTILLKSCAAQPVKPSAAPQAMYKVDINFSTLEFQWKMMPDLIETGNKQHQMGIKKVAFIRTICDIFNNCTFAKTMLCEVHQIIKIYLTVPVTSATAERSFPTLRRVKSYLRTTMTEKRLNHLILLHSHKHRTDELSVVEVAKELSLRNDRRKEFFGNFWHYKQSIVQLFTYYYNINIIHLLFSSVTINLQNKIFW